MKDNYLFQDQNRPTNVRVDDLISHLNINEKISQLLHESPAIERLGIPEYNWWNECLHGIARAGLATVFPQSIGLAATFDPDLVFRIASAISDEGRAKYHSFIKKGNHGRYRGLNFWSPNINIFRDPRWGRGQETYGEDPYLTAQIGVAYVKGLQGDDEKYLKVAACAKHFAVHSGPESSRHSFNAEVSLKDLYETYLPAFKALVEAGVESVMGAYNRVNGEPCCAHQYLLEKILRVKWGFTGHIVSDCWAIEDFHEYHKITKNKTESAAMAIRRGCDLNCGCSYKNLIDAFERGIINELLIDRALSRLLTTRFKLGMFDPEENNKYTKIPYDVVCCDKHRNLAKEAAEKSIVLLKNKNKILPLDESVKNIMLVGPQMTNAQMLLGNYFGLSNNLTTILEGIISRAPRGTSIDYCQGELLHLPKKNNLNWDLYDLEQADLVIAAFGLDVTIEGEEGDAIASETRGDRTNLRLPIWQEEYLKVIKKTGTPVILLLSGGSPIIFPYDIADAVLFLFYPGEAGGTAIAEILYGGISPSGRLPVTFPKSIDQLPPFENYTMQGRTYRYSKEEPLFPFGFGLSYTHFSYFDIELSKDMIKRGESIEVKIKVKNIGKMDGQEVIQLYITDLNASVSVPKYELKKFKRLFLKVGQIKILHFTITRKMMEIVNEEGRFVLEPGMFKIWIGGTSPNPRNEFLGLAQPITTLFEVIS